MEKYLVRRKDGTDRVVTILYDRNTRKYCFVNLTTCHVCACRFDSYHDAIEDLKNNENVKEYLLLPTEQ